MASPDQAAMVAAIAGTTRRMSMPASAPIANAASVQAASATPYRSNTVARYGVSSPLATIGLKYQENRTPNAPAAATTVTASSPSLATVQRHRPIPWVQ